MTQADRDALRRRRRALFGTAGGLGAVAAATTVLPGVAADSPRQTAPVPKPERGGGYQLSEHVRHYYRTTQV